ncbi:proton-coupled zinc antiporter SLC30A9, mitochondrial-like isoform X2 [Ptychodera flava]|uniref:proton-coupled zinc antiporter SLC30A9, mitochondrial-like isoform X2 n=1 Tax=Ptychodera flava TaxID=63121 RepID=UPI003969F266
MFCRLTTQGRLLQRHFFDVLPKISLSPSVQSSSPLSVQSTTASSQRQYHVLSRDWHVFHCNNSKHSCCCNIPKPRNQYTVRFVRSSGQSGKETSAKSDKKQETTSGTGTKEETTPGAGTKQEPSGTNKDAIIKVKPAIRRRKRIDYTKQYTDNNTITAIRAMKEYLLKSSDLDGIRKTRRRSPFDEADGQSGMMVYLRSDVEARAMEVWGSKEALDREKKKRLKQEEVYKEHVFLLKKAIKEHQQFYGTSQPKASMLQGSGRVVLTAITINALNFVGKLIAWLFSGSASMFSEAIHSLADTCNQIILAFGIYHSIRKPSPDHPYGYSNMLYVSSLISGVGIFCLGAGLSFYHGITGLLDPHPIGSLFWAYCILLGSLISEGATLVVAMNAIKKSAKAKGQSIKNYIYYARDPSVNVVLLEDTAAVLGVLVAGTCIGLTSLTGNPVYDSIGSIAVGGLLAMVSSFLIYSNSEVLLGRAIPAESLRKISDVLENDVMVRGVHDIKATDMGVNTVRFKAEVDFDGREITKSYLDELDVQQLLQEVQSFDSLEDMEAFMVKHGERIVDRLGAEVDRIERELKKRNPEVRHVDLEVL